MSKYPQPQYVSKRGCKALMFGQQNGYDFYILDLGTHPTAYVRVPRWHPSYKKEFAKGELENIDVHGGITYSRPYLAVSDHTFKGWWIGWDYAHWGDHLGWEPEMNSKRWTTEEILEDVTDVIRQLREAGCGHEGI